MAARCVGECHGEFRSYSPGYRLPLASMDKSDAARGPAPPHHMAAHCRLEAIQRQIKIGRKDVKRAVKLGSVIVDISHDAAVNARDSVNVKHRGLIDFNALKGSTLNHRNTSKKVIG